MPAIEQVCLPSDWRTGDLWPQVASATLDWLGQRGLAVRDAVVLVPFAALLAPGRQAFAALGGWQPRLETPLTLLAALGPAPAPDAGQCTGDTVLDRLTAREFLLGQDWARRWSQTDPAGFERIVGAVVDAAQALNARALACAPDGRAALWAQARATLGAPAGPAAAEALLLQLAVEWASQASAAATDALFELRPSAWITLTIGGADPIADAVLASSGARDGPPVLRLLADAAADEPFAAVACFASVHQWLCDDFEAEAQAAAACVIDALNAGQTPVALVALDRALVRRVRALLEREQLPLIDETGWVLATTRAAATVVGLLKAALPGAAPDAVLDWLKDWPGCEPFGAAALDSLEALWRERRHVRDRAAAERLWQHAQQHLRPLGTGAAAPLADWLRRLRAALARDGALERLQSDAAGSQVLAALRVLEDGDDAWQQASRTARLHAGGFVAWVQATLEQAPYLPPPDAGALVVLTPLALAFGRPFGHIVVPGADHRHLGQAQGPASLIGDRWAAALGLDHAAQRRERQHAALAHVLRAPQVTLLRRRRDDDEPLAASPAVEWLALCRVRAGLPAWPVLDWQPPAAPRTPQPVSRPLPSAAGALPDVLSASQLEALRACPYRFFGRAVLRLDEPEELDGVLAKRDYGNWLHAVLHRFHSQRAYGADAAAQLQQAADEVTRELALDEGELLPWRASFESLVPAYLSWCAAREAQGWFWADGESEHQCAPPQLAGLRLRGRIDRLDHGADGQRQLLDYKTGSAEALKKMVRFPLEETQLAFYAALLGDADDLAAAYVALDAADAPVEIEHAQVQQSARALLQGLGDEWQRLRQGAALAALGEGPVCDHCEVRGLCRRDHWEAL